MYIKWLRTLSRIWTLNTLEAVITKWINQSSTSHNAIALKATVKICHVLAHDLSKKCRVIVFQYVFTYFPSIQTISWHCIYQQVQLHLRKIYVLASSWFGSATGKISVDCYLHYSSSILSQWAQVTWAYFHQQIPVTLSKLICSSSLHLK